MLDICSLRHLALVVAARRCERANASACAFCSLLRRSASRESESSFPVACACCVSTQQTLRLPELFRRALGSIGAAVLTLPLLALLHRLIGLTQPVERLRHTRIGTPGVVIALLALLVFLRGRLLPLLAGLARLSRLAALTRFRARLPTLS